MTRYIRPEYNYNPRDIEPNVIHTLLPIPESMCLPGVFTELTIIPQVLCKIVGIRVTDEARESFELVDIQIGMSSIMLDYAGRASLRLWAPYPMAREEELKLTPKDKLTWRGDIDVPTCSPGQAISVTLKNLTDKSAKADIAFEIKAVR